MTSRRIAIFTGNRSEYGLLYPVINAIDSHSALKAQLIVSGTHLDERFGRTQAEIERDGFSIDAEVKMTLETDTLDETPRAIGRGILEVTDALEKLAPDMLLIYGDRFEAFAAAIASTQMCLPTAHIEGGDITEGGALDDSVRHAITKLAHLHFTTNAQATNRVLAMGEESWRVRTVGLPALDSIQTGDFASADDVQAVYGIDPTRPVVVFTQHSVASESDRAEVQIAPSLSALGALARDGVHIILTYPNSDPGGQRIITALSAFTGERQNVQLHPSLGRSNYHGLLGLNQQGVKVVCAGNSSSGLKETPAFGCPAVNIGNRQDNRLRADNIIDVDYDATAIEAALRKSLFDESFRRRCAECTNPYGDGNAAELIATALAEAKLSPELLQKGFTLRGEARDGWFR